MTDTINENEIYIKYKDFIWCKLNFADIMLKNLAECLKKETEPIQYNMYKGYICEVKQCLNELWKGLFQKRCSEQITDEKWKVIMQQAKKHKEMGLEGSFTVSFPIP